jgi:hypothetical protein
VLQVASSVNYDYVFWDVKPYSVVSTHQIKQIRDTSKENFVLIIIEHGISYRPCQHYLKSNFLHLMITDHLQLLVTLARCSSHAISIYKNYSLATYR